MEISGCWRIADLIVATEVARRFGKPLLHSIEIDIDLLKDSVCRRAGYLCRSICLIVHHCLRTDACYYATVFDRLRIGMLIVKLLGQCYTSRSCLLKSSFSYSSTKHTNLLYGQTSAVVVDLTQSTQDAFLLPSAAASLECVVPLRVSLVQ